MYQELHSISQAIATCSCYCSVGKSYPTLCDPTDCTMPGLPVSHYLPEFAQTMFIESVMPSNHLILHPSLLLLPSTFPASGSFPMSQLFASGDQSIGASPSASVPPVKIQGWFPLGWTGLLSLLSKGLSSLLQHHSLKASKVLGKLTFSSSTIMPTQKRSCFLLKTYTVWFWRNLSACILEWHWLSVGIY